MDGRRLEITHKVLCAGSFANYLTAAIFLLTRSWVYGRNNLYNLDRIPRDLGL